MTLYAYYLRSPIWHTYKENQEATACGIDTSQPDLQGDTMKISEEEPQTQKCIKCEQKDLKE